MKRLHCNAKYFKNCLINWKKDIIGHKFGVKLWTIQTLNYVLQNIVRVKLIWSWLLQLVICAKNSFVSSAWCKSILEIVTLFIKQHIKNGVVALLAECSLLRLKDVIILYVDAIVNFVLFANKNGTVLITIACKKNKWSILTLIKSDFRY